MVTIRDVAAKANVSVTTVSRVLNNKPDVSESTKARVKEAIEELGYKPSGLARGLVWQKTNSIGLIIPDINNPFFPALVKGIERRAKELGYSLILCSTENDKHEEAEALALLRSKQVDGIILSFSLHSQDALINLEKQGFPIVQIDRRIKKSNYPAVTIDNKKSAFRATEYLIEQGHTEIAHVTGDLNVENARERLEGFRLVIEKYGLNYRSQWILEGDYSRETGKALMEEIIAMPKRPTAIFFANDLMAFGAYEAIFNHDLNIPADFSIIGHDNVEIACFVKPGLTTMDQPKYRLGQIAAEKLISIIEGEKNHYSENVMLENDLVVRETVRKISS